MQMTISLDNARDRSSSHGGSPALSSPTPRVRQECLSRIRLDRFDEVKAQA